MTTPARGRSVGSAIAVAMWLTLAVALTEVVVLYFAKRSAPMFHVGPDFFWMAPLGLMAAAWLAIAPGVIAATVWRETVGVWLILFGSALPALLNLLMLVRGLSPYAGVLLAAGGAVQFASFAARHSQGLHQTVRRSAPVLVGAFLIVCAGIRLTTVGAVPLGAPGAIVGSPTRPPDVLLITLDTVRAANLTLYGYTRQTTPNLDRLAAKGVMFAKAFSTAPWTLPSHASLFTGHWPHELSAGYLTPLDATYPTLAEYLAARGYATAGFVGNLGYCGYGTGLGRGFGHYEDYQRSPGEVASSSTLLREVADNFKLRRWIQNDQQLNRVDAGDINERVLSWLSTHRATPTFVFLNYYDAHEPYLPPPPFASLFGPGRERGRYSSLHHWLWDPSSAHRPLSAREQQEEIDAYDGAVAYLDSRLGQLIDELDRRGTLEHTLVVITADHGEELGEHGLYDHGYSLYRPGLQVPLVVLGPGRVPAGRRVASSVSLRDVPATIVDVLGMGPGAPFPGQSLAARWTAAAEASSFQDTLLSEVRQTRGQPEWFPASKGDMVSAVSDGVHCIKGGDGGEELYDIETDPWERRNLAALPEYQIKLGSCLSAMERLTGQGARAVGAR